MADISALAKLTSINGSLARGGWELRFTALSDTDLLATNQRVVLDWYGMFGTGTPETDARRAFDGHVMPQRFRFDRMGSLSEFIAQTTDGFLRRGWLQGIGFADTDADARDHYHQFDSVTGGGAAERMTMGRLVRHILGYYDTLGPPPATCPDWVGHSNLVHHLTENPQGWIDLSNVTTAPFADPGNLDGSMRVNRYIVRESKNLWNTILDIAKNEYFVAYFTKLNEFYYCRHPMYQAVLPGTVMTFDEDFCIGKPTVEIRQTDQARQYRLDAVTDEGEVIHAEYPVLPVHVYGNVPRFSRVRCNSQDTLDEWARVAYLWENRDVTVKWTAPGLCGMLLEILDRIQITYTGTAENGVHINWNQKKFWVHDITVRPDDGFSGTSTFMLESESL